MPERFEYHNTGDTTEYSIYGDYWAFQTFTPQITHNITLVKLLLNTIAIECIIEGTPVYTPQGMIPIEKLKEGSPVYCLDLNNSSIQVSKVVSARQFRSHSFLKIYTLNGYVPATKEQPFYVIGKGWQKAKELNIGDWLQTGHGREQITGIESVIEPKSVCDLATEHYHNYLVGDSLILVHNKPIALWTDGGTPEATVSIRNFDPDLGPGAVDLTSNTFPWEVISTSVWKGVYLPKYRLYKDSEYMILLRLPAGDYDTLINWRASLVKDDDYPRGIVGGSGDGGETWWTSSDYDFLFEEWGVVGVHHHPTIPNEPTMGRILSGMGSLKVPKVRVAGNTYTVKTGTSDISTACNNKRSLARKSNGDLWCTYSRSDGTTNQIYCAYSTDGGKTWTEEQVTNQTAGNDQGYPSIAIDSSDNVHIVWVGLGWGTNTGYTNIQYRKRTTSWQTQEAVTDEANVDISYPSIAIDSSDNIHVAWTGRGYLPGSVASNIQYRKRTTEGWQTQEAITVEGIDQFCPAIAVDSAGNIHVAWIEGSVSATRYRKRTTSWQDPETVTVEGYGGDGSDVSPSIAIDASDCVHVAWYAWACGVGAGYDYFNIQYRKRTSEGWQDQEPVTDVAYDQYDPTIAIDASDNIHIVWRGRGWGNNTARYNIQYREKTTSWQTQVGITDRAYDQAFPILIWALYPTVNLHKTNRPKSGYALVWSGLDADGYKVEYFASSVLRWEAA